MVALTHEEIAARIRSATGGYVLACEQDEHDRLRVVLAVPGARRHDVARRALNDVCEMLRALDREAVDLTLLDPDDATVEQKHRLAAVTA
jgi:methylmalonyl-CoA mutase cobalamin-binding subunit